MSYETGVYLEKAGIAKFTITERPRKISGVVESRAVVRLVAQVGLCDEQHIEAESNINKIVFYNCNTGRRKLLSKIFLVGYRLKPLWPPSGYEFGPNRAVLSFNRGKGLCSKVRSCNCNHKHFFVCQVRLYLGQESAKRPFDIPVKLPP